MAASGYGGPSEGALAIQDRQARQAREIERPIICPECNSSWFSEVAFNQYSDIAMGSETGGDIRQINMMPQTLRVCMCLRSSLLAEPYRDPRPGRHRVAGVLPGVSEGCPGSP